MGRRIRCSGFVFCSCILGIRFRIVWGVVGCVRSFCSWFVRLRSLVGFKRYRFELVLFGVLGRERRRGISRKR